ncbi:hypothetical protein BN159_1736 [Streptomyces davaonensis JCM 4913]|uniref:Uncharacterized protein n=1 Tax=Streptomyces davaonensis (strain DSM 101723 / JCM 4913 / KCC S-0913 / 768) TaxID=1214101 RepID=K4QZ36_STRDJ|nr:hypothetical protein BN159_1736 [Streptomyces davaonensis JCM 4913]
MFGRVPEPKKLIEYEGQHYEILSNHLPEIVSRSAGWRALTLNR